MNKKSKEPEEMVSCADCGRSGIINLTNVWIISVVKPIFFFPAAALLTTFPSCDATDLSGVFSISSYNKCGDKLMQSSPIIKGVAVFDFATTQIRLMLTLHVWNVYMKDLFYVLQVTLHAFSLLIIWKYRWGNIHGNVLSVSHVDFAEPLKMM